MDVQITTATAILVSGLSLCVATLAFYCGKRFRDNSKELEELEHRLDVGLGQAREALSAYKLEVAKSYVTNGHIRDVEGRLTEHLIRIEGKLDVPK